MKSTGHYGYPYRLVELVAAGERFGALSKQKDCAQTRGLHRLRLHTKVEVPITFKLSIEYAFLENQNCIFLMIGLRILFSVVLASVVLIWLCDELC